MTDKKSISKGGKCLANNIDFPHFMEIPPECFVSLYIGSNIQDTELLDVNERLFILITLAWEINPDIKIYQMRLKRNKFELEKYEIAKEEFIEGGKKMLEQLKGK